MNADELTGIIAAFLAALSFGSYGVPMKGEAATRVDVDPLVFQSYNAVMVFVSCILL
jgi:drug/metabolite transporter (DMT)-like permease